jgi:hypothetical protein
MPENEPIFISEEFGAYTANQIEDLDEEALLELMEAWFRERYQPGGRDFRHHPHRFNIPTPFDLREILNDAFGDIVDLGFIDALAEKLQTESLAWTKRPIRQKNQTSEKADESATKLRLHDEILQRLANIESHLAQRPKPDSLIGHNRPPELLNDESDILAGAIAGAIADIQDELNKAKPDTLEVIVAHQAIKNSWKRIGDAIGPKVQLASDEFAKQLGKSAGSLPFWYGLYHLITGLLGPLEHWIRLVGL